MILQAGFGWWVSNHLTINWIGVVIMIKQTEQKDSLKQIEAEIEQMKTEEKIERIASFLDPFIRAVLLTVAILLLSNYLMWFTDSSLNWSNDT